MEVVKFFELRNMNVEHGNNLGLKERGGKVVIGEKTCLGAAVYPHLHMNTALSQKESAIKWFF